MTNYQTQEPEHQGVVKIDMNRDPITGKPGAHPVGTGTGAAVGGAIGGVVGAVGGPLGIAAGAAIGGVAGGLVGKTAAEAVNPTGEVEYWRNEFVNRPYASGRNFDDFAPVYYSTAEAYRSNSNSTFEDIEPRLEQEWMRNPSNSRLSWTDARNASKDAWNRLAKATKGSTSEEEHEAAEQVNSLVEVLYDGAKGFEQASDAAEAPHYKNGFSQFAAQRLAFILELKPMIASRGEQPQESGTVRGALHRGWTGIKAALTSGDKAILSECERGEDVAVAKYRSVLQSDKLTPEIESVVRRQYQQVQATHSTVRQWRDSAAA